MSDEAPLPLGSASLEIDLARSFLPAWAQESKPAAPEQKWEDRGEDPRARRNKGRERRPRRESGARRPERRSKHPAGRRLQQETKPALEGWRVQILADPRGEEGLARQIKTDARAYPLFDLALLVLERPERYLAELRRDSAAAPALYQLPLDGSVWTSEREAIEHVLARHLDKFYRREQVAVDPPKGTYSFVAVCGMSGILLGPPNYHDYQTKLRRLHAERFAHLPFEVYKGRVRMERGEEFIQKWKEEQSTRDEFLPADAPEGAEAIRLRSLNEVERHFRQAHASAIVPAGDRITLSGAAPSAPPIRQLIRRTAEELHRFPLPLAHALGQSLSAKGLQIFKAHANVTYAAAARPRFLDRSATPVAEAVGAMLDYLEAHPRVPRAEQWKALLALRPAAPENEREAAVARDLLWLLRQGYVMDYARRGLEAVRKAKPHPERAGKAPPPESPASAPPALGPASGPS